MHRVVQATWSPPQPLCTASPVRKHAPSHRSTALFQTTLPSFRMQVMVSEPCVPRKPSSHRKEMELPSWRLSPNRFPFTGMPGSGHSLCRKAVWMGGKDVIRQSWCAGGPPKSASLLWSTYPSTSTPQEPTMLEGEPDLQNQGPPCHTGHKAGDS